MNFSHIKLRLFALTLAMLTLALNLSAQQTNTYGMHAVPAKNLTIDGRLNDWDLSGQRLICYDVGSLSDIYSGKVAFAYDAENLYVAIQWKDPVPMGNSHDPKFQSHRGWAGDSLQLRVMTDRVTHVTAWYFGGTKEPFIDMSYGKSLTQPFGGGRKKLLRQKDWKLSDGAEMAFQADADGKGYVQEIKIPWKLITRNKTYKPGDFFRCGVELLWGEVDWPAHRYADNLAEGSNAREFFHTALQAWGKVTLEKNGNLKLPDPTWKKALQAKKAEGPIAITYELPKDSRVTIAIDDMNGKRIRNLLPAAKRKAGKHTELWDGLDDKGDIVKPGSYQVKGLTHDGLHLKYTGAFASPGNPPWASANGKGAFYGDHTAPMAVAAGSKMLALACPMGETGKHLIGVDMTGQRQWGLANRVAFGGGRISLATDDNILYIANADSRSGKFSIWRCFLKDGKYAPWKRKDATGRDILDLPIMNKDAVANCRAIALANNQLAVILAAKKELLILDATTGDEQKRFTNFPAGMSSLAFDSKGNLFLSTDSKVYQVALADGKLSEKIKGLDNATGISFDKKDQLYVAQRGKTQAVDVFNNFKKIKRIGKSGGRPAAGFFIKNAMRNPSQIAVDAKGRLWVTESTKLPKRTSVWNADGTLALDLVGTTPYCEGGILNPFDPTRGFTNGVEYKIDFKNKKYEPLFTLRSPFSTDKDYESHRFPAVTKIARVNGREYVQTKSSARGAIDTWIYARQDDGSWKAVAAFGGVGRGKTAGALKFHAKFNKQYQTPMWEGMFGKAFIWVDKNDDGLVQRNEIQTDKLNFRAFYWGQAMGDDLSLPYIIATDKKQGFASKEIKIFKPASFSKTGVPQYSFSENVTINPTTPIKPGGEGMIAHGRNDRVYINMNPLTAISKEGKVLWTYPNKYVSVHGSHKAPASKEGLLIGPSSFYGTAYINKDIGEVFYLNGNLGQNFILTEDGLWVQSLYKDTRGWYDVPNDAIPGMPCDAMTAGGESFYGDFCKSSDGKYYTVGGATSAVVMEITGLDSLKRFGQTVKVDAKDIAAAQQLKIKKASMKTQAKKFAIQKIKTPPAIDGDLKNWDMEKGILFKEGRHTLGHANLKYDDHNLYIAYQVYDRQGPLKNTGQNEQLMFISGDCVDLMLRSSGNSKDAKLKDGDLRLLMTVKNGKPIAVIYRPVVKGTTPSQRTALSSPWRSVYFDEIKTVEFPLVLKPAKGGYAVTAAIPLKLLGIASPKGKSFRADLGLLGSDKGGQETVSRKYWSNKFTNNTNDVPDEAIMTPALWGEFKFE